MHVTPAGTQVMPGMKFTLAGTLYEVACLSAVSKGEPYDQTLITSIGYKKPAEPRRQLDMRYPQIAADDFDRTCTLVRDD